MITQTVIDNFHPVAKPIALMARGLGYGPQEYQGHTYKGIGLGYSPELFWETLGIYMGRAVSPKMEFFRLTTKNEDQTTYIHADNACAKNAVVWYLSEPPEGVVAGTAFWRHLGSGKHDLSEKEREDEGYVKTLESDGFDESKWVMSGLCGQRFNRCVVYPANCFHSRYPKNGWGESAADGRIIYTGFFD